MSDVQRASRWESLARGSESEEGKKRRWWMRGGGGAFGFSALVHSSQGFGGQDSAARQPTTAGASSRPLSSRAQSHVRLGRFRKRLRRRRQRRPSAAPGPLFVTLPSRRDAGELLSEMASTRTIGGTRRRPGLPDPSRLIDNASTAALSRSRCRVPPGPLSIWPSSHSCLRGKQRL